MALEGPAALPFFERARYWAVSALLAGVLGVLAVAFWPRRVPISEIRVRNASAVPLHHVIVGATEYGDIAPGATTRYMAWSYAYPEPKMQFDIPGTRLQRIPDDHFGESVLGVGHYTYVITVDQPSSAMDFKLTTVQDDSR